MTPEARAGIGNGIWLCAEHGRLVDTDAVFFTPEKLHSLKGEHERRCKLALGFPVPAGRQRQHLLAIGPEIVGVGDLDRAENHRWRIRIEHFVSGSFASLVNFSEAFATIPAYDRHVVLNSLGEGRSLIGGCSVERRSEQVFVDCEVAPSFHRTLAAELGTDWALSASHDLTAENGHIATVSGLAALPQKLLTCLSMQRGESPFHSEFGSRLSEYWTNFAGSLWLGELFKLDVIRMACIPYADAILGQSYTPLHCVERVNGVEVIGELTLRRLPVRLNLQIAGVGAWSRDLAVFVDLYQSAVMPTRSG